jgi:pre-mRNA-splicing factor 38B
VTQNIYQSVQSQIEEENSNLTLAHDPQFTIYGDPLTCNLNPLILNNILSCQYFKEDCASKGFNEIIDEIIQNVTYAEPWAVGISGVPSTLFCCLYKLMLLKLTEGQVNYLINSIDSPYVRCAGFLYIRYLSDPKDLWNRLSPYLEDDKVFLPKADRKYQIRIGEYVENLLLEYDYYGTRLPRIPTTIERDIKGKLLLYKQGVEQGEIVESYRDENYSTRVSKKKSRSRSRSRSRKHKKHKKDRKRKSRSRSYSSDYSSRSRSRSRHRKKKDRKRDRSKSWSRSRSISPHRSSRSRSPKYKKHERYVLILINSKLLSFYVFLHFF